MGLPPKPRLASWLNPKGVRTPKRAADEAAPMLRQLRTKFIALNMTLAALVLAASFATICYADYRADIDDVRNRLMAATSRSLHEPQLIPDAEPFHRGEAPGKTARTPQAPMARTMTTIALETRRPVAPTRTTTRKAPRAATQTRAKALKARKHPQRTARPPLPPRISAPAPAIPISRHPASEAPAPPRRPRCPWRSTTLPTARSCN